MPGFTYDGATRHPAGCLRQSSRCARHPKVGPLGLSSPPSRSDKASDHRYYDPLRLLPCPSRVASLSLASRYLACSSWFVSPLGFQLAGRNMTGQGQGSWSAGTPHLPALRSRRQVALPSSRATPLNACPALRPRWCPDDSPSAKAVVLGWLDFPVSIKRLGFERTNHLHPRFAPSGLLPLPR